MNLIAAIDSLGGIGINEDMQNIQFHACGQVLSGYRKRSKLDTDLRIGDKGIQRNPLFIP